MNAISRRTLVGRGALAAGATVLPASLLGAEVALAQADAETDALERLIALERAAALAPSLAAEEAKLGNATKRALENISRQNAEHAAALAKALDSLGVDPPEVQGDQADFSALEAFKPDAAEAVLIRFLIGLESDLVAAYETETTEFKSGDLFRTAAQVGASHAQHLVVLRLLAGETDGLIALPAASGPKTQDKAEGA